MLQLFLLWQSQILSYIVVLRGCYSLYSLLSKISGIWNTLILIKDTLSIKESYSLFLDCFLANLVKLVKLG